MFFSTEPNPCEDPLLNYCHINAECNVTSARGFGCRCKPGHLDVSDFPIEAPGEQCQREWYIIDLHLLASRMCVSSSNK